MKIKKIRIQWCLSVYILIAAAILYFIYSLGFMTNFYRLFYDGDNTMLDLLKELQLLNRFIFENSLITLILAIIALGLGIHAMKTSLFNTLFLLGFFAYEINSLFTYLSAIPYYVNAYASLDFSAIENYHSSPFILYLSYVFSIGIIVILLATVIIYMVQVFKNKKSSKGVKADDEG